MKFTVILFSLILLFGISSHVVSGEKFTIARLKYQGGGDWYSNPTSLPNLLKFLRENTDIDAENEPEVVSISGEELFNYPIVYMNGHGNVSFSDEEATILRKYLTGGGFLFADDNYGMDKSFRSEMKKIFPDKEMVLLPKEHPIFSDKYPFPEGLPKIHEHDGIPAEALAYFHDGRMVVFYSYQSDLGDGWEDKSVHNDPDELHQAALKMGSNVILWALSH